MKGIFGETHQYIQAAGKLRDLLEIYELWDVGDYYEANEQTKKLSSIPSFIPPPAIIELCRYPPSWPNVCGTTTVVATANQILTQISNLANGITGTQQNINNSLYLQKKLLSYVEDELKRIHRLIMRNDYRSALIKAYGVIEFLLVSQLLARLNNDLFEIKVNHVLNLPLTNNQKKGLTERIFQGIFLTNALNMLSDPAKELNLNFKSKIFPFNKGDSVQISLKNTSTPIPNFWATLSISDIDILRELRNKAVHFCLWISKNIAEASYQWAEKCFESFISNLEHTGLNWKYTRPTSTFTMNWTDLCRLSNIEFLLD